DLIGSDGPIWRAVGPDTIGKLLLLGAPEAGQAALTNVLGELRVAGSIAATEAELLREALHDAKRVVPEGLDLDRLAGSLCDDVLTDLRVHPGELQARCPAGQEKVLRIHADAVERALDEVIDDAGQHVV